MILASRVRNKENTLSLDSGTELTQTRINHLAENKIVYVDVMDEGSATQSARDYFLANHDSEGLTLEEKVHTLFCRTQMDHPFVRELMRHSAKRLHPKYPQTA